MANQHRNQSEDDAGRSRRNIGQPQQDGAAKRQPQQDRQGAQDGRSRAQDASTASRSQGASRQAGRGDQQDMPDQFGQQSSAKSARKNRDKDQDGG